MTIDLEKDYSVEFAAEDEAIRRVADELRALRGPSVDISEAEVTDVIDKLTHQPGPIVAKHYRVLADPEKFWKVVPHHFVEPERRQAA